MVDTDRRALVIQARPADIQDRDEAIPLSRASRKSFRLAPRWQKAGLYRAIGEVCPQQ
jgi:hypothetical protein